MGENPNNEVIPKATVEKILNMVLEVYNSGDAQRREDFFERELPALLESGDFSLSPKQD